MIRSSPHDETHTGAHAAVRTRLESLVGVRGIGRISLAIRPWMRVISYAPMRCLRILGLRLAKAKISSNVLLEPGVVVLSPWRLSIGSHTNIARGVRLDARGQLSIGDNVNISEEVAVWTAEHDIQSPTFPITRGAVVIEDYVWLCFRCIVLPGVTLGKGSVIASGSVVTKNVPPFSFVAGVPARVVRTRNQHLTYRLGTSPTITE
jgi:acetyltransferase-like isoleucine patch superfamily enzyme